LGTVPEVKGKSSAAQRQTRLERIQADGGDPDYPLPGDAGYLLEYFWEIGPTLSSSMGPAALTNSELVYWQQNSGVDLTPWEAKTLVRLSRSYLAEGHAAIKPDCPPPHGDLVVKTAKKRKQVDRNLDAFLG
jgi:hypothetical protein